MQFFEEKMPQTETEIEKTIQKFQIFTVFIQLTASWLCGRYMLICVWKMSQYESKKLFHFLSDSL